MYLDIIAPPAKFWYRAGSTIEIDLGELLIMAYHAGFRLRGSDIFRLVPDHRQAIASNRTQYFAWLRSCINQDDPDALDAMDAVAEAIRLYSYEIIFRLEALESFYPLNYSPNNLKKCHRK